MPHPNILCALSPLRSGQEDGPGAGAGQQSLLLRPGSVDNPTESNLVAQDGVMTNCSGRLSEVLADS
jgi:hypothetical protein